MGLPINIQYGLLIHLYQDCNDVSVRSRINKQSNCFKQLSQDNKKI